jgi:hypothetical protein
MKGIVLRFGLASGAILILTSVVVLLCVRGTINFDHGQIFGYAAMVLSFLMVFFGIRSYRDHVGAGAIGFGKAFQVGILITLSSGRSPTSTSSPTSSTSTTRTSS